MNQKKNAGFTLVEVLVAIVILGMIIIPVTSGILVALKAMNRSESMMQAQLDVSSTVEILMAEGITAARENYRPEDFPDVTVKTLREVDASGKELPYYQVTVSSDTEESVAVTTTIRKAGGAA